MSDDLDSLTLTTNHAASSYGRPVLVIGGEAYGPADMTPAGMTAAELVALWAARLIEGVLFEDNAATGEGNP